MGGTGAKESDFVANYKYWSTFNFLDKISISY